MIDQTDEEKAEDELTEHVLSFTRDPLGYVKYAFPWGEPGTELEEYDGPDVWQTEQLTRLGDRLREGYVKENGGLRFIGEAIQMAVASGHGIGKSALVSWLILWAMSTFEDTKGVVTANTATQLATKTWAELAKWHRMSINSHWFIYESTSLHSSDPAHEKTWRIDAIPWSKSKGKAEAFAGLHNKGKRILLIFDEASGIDDIIWETSEGALTDANTEIIWVVFGNPLHNTGRFRECWRKFRDLWRDRWQIDARTCRMTNKKNIDRKIKAYQGLDNDYIKVRVLGLFPKVGDRQFIGSDLVDAARGRHLDISQYKFAPIIIGVDPAWTGGDETTIWLRQGLYSTKLMGLPKNDDDNIPAGHIARFEDEFKADAVFIDQGWGTGIYSAGKLMKRKWQLISFAGESPDIGFLNMRVYMWNLMKQWLKEGGALPNLDGICEDLIGPEYITLLNGKIKLESKEDMKERGLNSPDDADGLGLTFARPVLAKPTGRALLAFHVKEMQGGEFGSSRTYDPLAPKK